MLLILAGCSGGGDAPAAQNAAEVAGQLARVRIEPGLWERRSEVVDVRAEAVPVDFHDRLKARGGTSRHCISPEQAASPQAQFLAGRDGAACENRGFAMADGRISGDMACSDPRSGGRWTARLDGRYSQADYALDVAIEMPSPFDPGQLTIVNRVSGRRLGECPPAPAATATEGKS